MRLLSRSRQYGDLYTWSHALDHDVIAHSDGGVSLLIEWSGLDAEMLSGGERAQAWTMLYSTLGALATGYCAEFHWWREWDEAPAEAYLRHAQTIRRGGALAHALRAAQAEHLRHYGLSNSVALVLVKLPRTAFFRGARHALKNQVEDAEALRAQARRLLPNLPGARIAPVSSYLRRIMQSVDRPAFEAGAAPAHDPQLLLSEQLLRSAPGVDDGCVRIGHHLTRVQLVHLYPDADAAWFFGLSALPLPMHVVAIVRALDTRAALRAAERQSDVAEGTLGRRGRDRQTQTVRDLAAFRAHVAENALRIFQNSYIIHLHGTRAEITEHGRLVDDRIMTAGGQVRAASYVQLPYFRTAQPGQGYRAPLFRTDHALQVANMLPVQVYSAGESAPESLRLGTSGALIGFRLTNQPVAHSFTVAMTGGGKGVDKVATIAETYPYGIDWYILEIGASYKWVVEGFGGTYTTIDPTETVVNPLPPYAAADDSAPIPLDAIMAGCTVNALAFLLTDGRTEFDVHERAAAETALQLLYAVPDSTLEAPNLADYLVWLERTDYDTPEQRDGAARMAANLHSFLETAAGRIFARRDNLLLSEGITGCDLKEVDRASPALLRFYLVFISLRFKHMAFARRTQARVLLDEMHKFVADAPQIVGRLVSELARMGRKDSAAIDIVTQGIREIDCLEKEIINSMPLRSLLYRGDEWEAIAGRINMPPGPLSAWRAFRYPLNDPWRPAIRSVGPEYYNLHLTFPPMILDLASTTPRDLDLKAAIGARTRDPLERLQRLAALRAQPAMETQGI
ncbi:MAG: hypothetical protein ACYDDO_04745 [Acidiferrobacterales bacterium]